MTPEYVKDMIDNHLDEILWINLDNTVQIFPDKCVKGSVKVDIEKDSFEWIAKMGRIKGVARLDTVQTIYMRTKETPKDFTYFYR